MLARRRACRSLPLLGGIAWRTSNLKTIRAIEEKISHNPWLMDVFERYTQQAERWGINFEREPWILGSGLDYDSQKKIFTGEGANRANQYLKRQTYRGPFVVPEVVSSTLYTSLSGVTFPAIWRTMQLR